MSDVFPLCPTSDVVVLWYLLPVAQIQEPLISGVWYRPPVGLDSSTEAPGYHEPSVDAAGCREVTVPWGQREQCKAGKPRPAQQGGVFCVSACVLLTRLALLLKDGQDRVSFQKQSLDNQHLDLLNSSNSEWSDSYNSTGSLLLILIKSHTLGKRAE